MYENAGFRIPFKLIPLLYKSILHFYCSIITANGIQRTSISQFFFFLPFDVNKLLNECYLGWCCSSSILPLLALTTFKWTIYAPLCLILSQAVICHYDDLSKSTGSRILLKRSHCVMISAMMFMIFVPPFMLTKCRWN